MNLADLGIFGELEELVQDEGLRQLVRRCTTASQGAGKKMRAGFESSEDAKHAVSEAALNGILHRGDDISDIRTNTNISNCLVFHTKNLQGTVIDQEVVDLRNEIDEIVKERAKDLFDVPLDAIGVSGHFWYPPGGYMGWHTNLRKPGWRLYINVAEEKDRSFFRYRDPVTGEIVTCDDDLWNCRVFQIRQDLPFWHCVYSETNRHSFGYRIDKPLES